MVTLSSSSKTLLRWASTLFGLCVFVTLSMIADVQLRYLDRIHTTNLFPIETQGTQATALILGAGFKRDGTPSDALKDRLDEGAALYRQNLAQRLFVTADDGSYRADEITVMKKYLLSIGLPEDRLVIDGKGYRTYESCKNAAQQFPGEKIIIVTQRFHIGRALYLCNQLGVDAIGSTADKRPYERIIFFWARDLLASVKAWWDIHVQVPNSPVETE